MTSGSQVYRAPTPLEQSAAASSSASLPPMLPEAKASAGSICSPPSKLTPLSELPKATCKLEGQLLSRRKPSVKTTASEEKSIPPPPPSPCGRRLSPSPSVRIPLGIAGLQNPSPEEAERVPTESYNSQLQHYHQQLQPVTCSEERGSSSYYEQASTCPPPPSNQRAHAAAAPPPPLPTVATAAPQQMEVAPSHSQIAPLPSMESWYPAAAAPAHRDEFYPRETALPPVPPAVQSNYTYALQGYYSSAAPLPQPLPQQQPPLQQLPPPTQPLAASQPPLVPPPSSHWTPVATGEWTAGAPTTWVPYQTPQVGLPAGHLPQYESSSSNQGYVAPPTQWTMNQDPNYPSVGPRQGPLPHPPLSREARIEEPGRSYFVNVPEGTWPPAAGYVPAAAAPAQSWVGTGQPGVEGSYPTCLPPPPPPQLPPGGPPDNLYAATPMESFEDPSRRRGRILSAPPRLPAPMHLPAPSCLPAPRKMGAKTIPPKKMYCLSSKGVASPNFASSSSLVAVGTGQASPGISSHPSSTTEGVEAAPPPPGSHMVEAPGIRMSLPEVDEILNDLAPVLRGLGVAIRPKKAAARKVPKKRAFAGKTTAPPSVPPPLPSGPARPNHLSRRKRAPPPARDAARPNLRRSSRLLNHPYNFGRVYDYPPLVNPLGED